MVACKVLGALHIILVFDLVSKPSTKNNFLNMRIQIGLQCILAFGSILLLTLVQGNEFEDFLIQAMKKYPAWLNDNNLDPFYAKGYNLTVDYNGGGQIAKMAMWDVTVKHHSKVNTDLTTVRVFNKRQIELNYKIQSPVEFRGTYWVKGSWGSDDLYDGHGGYHVTSMFTSLYNATLSYHLTIENVQTSPDCFIDMSKTTFTSKVDIYQWNEFENLNGGPYVGHYAALLGRITVDRLDQNRFAPLQQLIDMYFTKLFEETPFCDLAN